MVLTRKVFLFILSISCFHANGQAFKTFSGLQKISKGDIWFEYNKHDNDTFPTVVFEAGAMSYSNYWNPVFDTITNFANAIKYDRAGLGRSGPSIDSIRSAVQIAHELNELLDSLKVNNSIILVCHSAGGFYGRALTYLYEERVKMLILIESPCSDWEELLRSSLSKKQNNERDSIIELNRSSISFFELQEYKAAEINRSFLVQLPPLNIPVYIISGSGHIWPEGYKSHLNLLNENWGKCQESLLNISSNSSLTIVPNVGHHLFQNFNLSEFIYKKVNCMNEK